MEHTVEIDCNALDYLWTFDLGTFQLKNWWLVYLRNYLAGDQNRYFGRKCYHLMLVVSAEFWANYSEFITEPIDFG
jgi:hypothetical protein